MFYSCFLFFCLATPLSDTAVLVLDLAGGAFQLSPNASGFLSCTRGGPLPIKDRDFFFFFFRVVEILLTVQAAEAAFR